MTKRKQKSLGLRTNARTRRNRANTGDVACPIILPRSQPQYRSGARGGPRRRRPLAPPPALQPRSTRPGRRSPSSSMPCGRTGREPETISGRTAAPSWKNSGPKNPRLVRRTRDMPRFRLSEKRSRANLGIADKKMRTLEPGRSGRSLSMVAGAGFEPATFRL